MAKIQISGDRIQHLLLGTGRIDSQGDSSMTLDKTKGFLAVSNLAASQIEAHKAKSSQWKNSRVFDLSSLGLLYIPEEAFKPHGSGEFQARLKQITESGSRSGSRDFILFCSFQ
jgi:hypothetical protein